MGVRFSCYHGNKDHLEFHFPIRCGCCNQSSICSEVEWFGCLVTLFFISPLTADTNRIVKHQYYRAVTIPDGAANVLVTEVRPSRNAYIAAGSNIETKYINFHYRIAPSHVDLWLAGTVWKYERPSGSPEYLRTDAVIHDNVTVFILTNETTEGIRFSFSLPKETASSWRPVGGPVYYWNTTEWEGCDTGCEGVQEREVMCVEVREDGGRGETNESHCNTIAKPLVTRACPLCQYGWNSTEWSQCNARCGEGTLRREVHCTAVREGETMTVSERFCAETTKPVMVQSCVMEPCRYNWQVGEWGKCDVVCGEGWMNRDVTCLLQLKDGEWEATVSDSHCSGSKPADSVSCQAESCEHFQWVASEWTEVRVVTVMCVCSLIPRPLALSLAVRYRDFPVLLVMTERSGNKAVCVRYRACC